MTLQCNTYETLLLMSDRLLHFTRVASLEHTQNSLTIPWHFHHFPWHFTHFYCQSHYFPRILPGYIKVLEMTSQQKFNEIWWKWHYFMKKKTKNGCILKVACDKIPWHFPDIPKNPKIPWLSTKFPDISLTWKKYFFSLTFPWRVATLFMLVGHFLTI